MFAANFGDLAQATLLRRSVNDANTELNRLTEEFASGRVADLQTHLRGEFAPIAAVERSLALQEAYTQSNTSARQFAESQQIALTMIQGISQGASADFLTVGDSGNDAPLEGTIRGATSQLEQIVAGLNSTYAGRSLFGGTATQSRPLADVDTMLTALEAEIAAAGATTPGQVATVLDQWFDTPGGGFETLGYLGSTTSLAPFEIGEGQTARLTARADDTALRETMKAFSLVAVLDRGVLSGEVGARRAAVLDAGFRLTDAIAATTVLEADIGFQQQLIEEAQTATNASNLVFTEARERLIGADPFDTAVELQSVQTQVQTLYTLTARLSQLSLTNVL